MLKLVWRNLTRHPLRSLLTMASLAIALFLLCFLMTLITTINAGVKYASNTRLVVQSAVSLFVSLPPSYQEKLAAVPGVEATTKWTWFGGVYKEPRNFFAQFATDPATMLKIYPECRLPDDQVQAWMRRRSSCIIGSALSRDYGWKVGDRVPLIGALFPHPSGGAWEFEVAGIYESSSQSFDNRTMFFHWDYFKETMESIPGREAEAGVYVLKATPDASIEDVIANVEALFMNGPQRVQCTTEAEFQRQFVSMIGNLPLFVGWIGTGVLFAILLACFNTMLMSAREQIHDIGIVKALGFDDGAVFRLLILQALALCCVGGAIGLFAVFATQGQIVALLGMQFPGYKVTPETFALAAGITLAIGLVAGVFPAWRSSRLRAVEALRSIN